jgi:hypothetical protein
MGATVDPRPAAAGARPPPADAASATAATALEIGHPALRDLHRYWEARRSGRAMPSRADMDPVELPRALLPNLFLVDVEGSPPRFRYRLVGTELTAVMRRELRGRYIDEMPFLFRKFALPAYAEVMARAAPTYREINAIEALWRIRYKRLLLPLSEDGARINMILGAIFRS